MGSIKIFKPLSTFLVPALLINLHCSSDKFLGMLRFEPGAARREAIMLPLCYAAPPPLSSRVTSPLLPVLITPLTMFQELNKRQTQLESAHSMLMRHHDQTRELEMRQQKSVHGLREEHLRRQHDTELTNQVGSWHCSHQLSWASRKDPEASL